MPWWLEWIGWVAGGCLSVAVIGRGLILAGRIASIVQRELQANGGGSMKDYTDEARQAALDAVEEAQHSHVQAALASNAALHVSDRIDAIGAELNHLTRIVTDSLEWQRDHENNHRRSSDHKENP